MKPSRQNQYVVLDATPPFVVDEKTRGIRLPDGSIVTPEVQIVDQNGKIFNLTSWTLFSTTSGVWRRGFYLPALPQGRKYRTVRIRSERPITISKITWLCHTGK